MSSDKSSSLLSFCLFAHDITIIFENNLQKLESLVNRQLVKVNEWLKANKLTLTTDKKPRFVIFRRRQKTMSLIPRIRFLGSATIAHENL